MEPISAKYRGLIMKMIAASRGQSLVADHNVHQLGNAEILPYIDAIIEDNLLAGSRIAGMERLEELFAGARAGQPSLLLLEHYSNFDLPVFHYLLRRAGGRGVEIAEAILAIAGIKLNESHPAVLAFTEAYSRLVIYPSRSMEIIKEHIKEPKELVAEMMRSTQINRAAMKALAKLKSSGNMVLVFPAGTRFRPWDPGTKKAVREIDSYVKSFSRMCLVAVNGNILRLSSGGEMDEDLICQDRVVFTVSPPMSCEEFRARVKHEHRFREDKKQAVADEIMAGLERIHDAAEKDRLET